MYIVIKVTKSTPLGTVLTKGVKDMSTAEKLARAYRKSAKKGEKIIVEEVK